MSSSNDSRWALWAVCMFVAVFLGFYQGWSKLNVILLSCFLVTGGVRLLIPWFENQGLNRVQAMATDEREEFLNRLPAAKREELERKLQTSDS